MEKTTELAPMEPQGYLILSPAAQKAADMLAKSAFVPKAFQNKPADILAALQWGSELGLSPMASLKNIAVINGQPAIWGDTMLAMVRRSPLCEDVIERIEGEGDNAVAICIVKRRGATEVISKFSAADAKKAGLWGKNVWASYPSRMLQMRARGFALRDAFPDILNGLITTEEAQDYPSAPSKHSDPIDAEFHEQQPAPQLQAPIPDAVSEEIEALGYVPQAINARAQQVYSKSLADLQPGQLSNILEKLRANPKNKQPEPAQEEDL